MSDMVDMMLDGIVCQYCGVLIDGTSSGYPRGCGCNSDDYYAEELELLNELLSGEVLINSNNTNTSKRNNKKRNNKKSKKKKKNKTKNKKKK